MVCELWCLRAVDVTKLWVDQSSHMFKKWCVLRKTQVWIFQLETSIESKLQWTLGYILLNCIWRPDFCPLKISNSSLISTTFQGLCKKLVVTFTIYILSLSIYLSLSPSFSLSLSPKIILRLRHVHEEIAISINVKWLNIQNKYPQTQLSAS